MATVSAPGKVILFGEHAVVYGRPAIAVPVVQVGAQATVTPLAGDVRIEAPDIGRTYGLSEARPGDPLARIIQLTCQQLGVEPRDFRVEIRSTIPVARGLGSGAAVSVAIARALAQFFGRELGREEVSALAFEVEKLHHGTPSGVDNTVIAFATPLYYVRGQAFEPFYATRPFQITIADTGIRSPTRIAVGDVRRAHEKEPARLDALFDQIGDIVQAARRAIVEGKTDALGPLMNENQALARALGVSSPPIERLIRAALDAGAVGAKLSGAGRGGNVIALVDDESRGVVEAALVAAGAQRVIVTRVE